MTSEATAVVSQREAVAELAAYFEAHEQEKLAKQAKAMLGQVVVDPKNPRWLFRRGPGGRLKGLFICGPGDPEDFLYRGTRRPDGTRDGDQMKLIAKLKPTGANCIYIQAVRSHGGDVRTRARVERIEVEDGKVAGVELRGGEKLSAPIVVSNADIKKTFLDLVGEEQLSPKTVKIMRRSRMALPLFCVYLGLDVDLRERMPNTNFFVNPDYDIEGAYAECYAGRVPENLPLYVTSASVKDPRGASAPEGCSSIEMVAVAPADYSFWHVNEGPAAGEGYSRNPDYLAVKEWFTEKLIDGAAQVIPDIRDHILWKEASTPITHERYTLASGGTSYGMEHSPDQSGMRRPRAKTEIEGLYLAGASTVYAHGIAGVMFGGLACAGAVLRRDLQAQVFGGRVFGDPDKLTSGGPGWD
ncbi:hypothetical protein LCGC14_2617490, partial [marine sediment metagenome]